MEALPELLDLAERRGGEHCDNLSAVAVSWREARKQAPEQMVITETMPLYSFTSQLKEFGAGAKDGKDVYLSDAEIEKAIKEIRDAIRKVTKP
jgi:hypothetical protein